MCISTHSVPLNVVISWKPGLVGKVCAREFRCRNSCVLRAPPFCYVVLRNNFVHPSVLRSCLCVYLVIPPCSFGGCRAIEETNGPTNKKQQPRGANEARILPLHNSLIDRLRAREVWLGLFVVWSEAERVVYKYNQQITTRDFCGQTDPQFGEQWFVCHGCPGLVYQKKSTNSTKPNRDDTLYTTNLLTSIILGSNVNGSNRVCLARRI